MGEALKQMAEVKYALEDNVKQNFLEPLNQLQSKDVRDVQVQMKLSFYYLISHLIVYLSVSSEKIGKSSLGF